MEAGRQKKAGAQRACILFLSGAGPTHTSHFDTFCLGGLWSQSCPQPPVSPPWHRALGFPDISGREGARSSLRFLPVVRVSGGQSWALFLRSVTRPCCRALQALAWWVREKMERPMKSASKNEEIWFLSGKRT